MSAAEALGLPPGVRFDPTGDELVEFYLLPRALGRQPAVPGIIIEDDDDTSAAAVASTSAQHPWKLLTRHRRTDDNEAYFFERTVAGSTDDAATRGGGAGGARHQDRSCGGGRWTWVGQKRAPDEALPLRRDGDGERVKWGKYSLNLQEGRRRGGSTGWVMHEYTVAVAGSTTQQCPLLLPVKLCHVSFTGHGQKRQRVPDDDDDVEGEGQEVVEPPATPPPQHKRAATGSCMATMATATPDHQELSEAPAQKNQQQQFPNFNYTTTSPTTGHFWSTDAGFGQEPFAMKLTQNQNCSAIQSQAYHQEQFVFMNPAGSSAETHGGALPASDLGSRQEPPEGHLLIEEQQFSVAQLLGGISPALRPPTTPAAYHEQQQQHIQSFAPAATTTADLPLSTEQSHGNMDQYDDFFMGWGDINSFCDTSGIQSDGGVAAADGYGVGSSWDRHFFYQQPEVL